MRYAILATLLAFMGCASAGPTASDPALRVGIAPTAAPIAFKEDGKIVGVEVDLAMELGRRLDRPVRFVSMDFDELIPALLDGRIDIIMAGMSITRDRARVVAFCEPYLRVGQMAAVRPDRAARYVSIRSVLMTDAAVGYERGTTAELVVTTQFPKARGKAYRSLPAAADAMARGEVEVILGDGPSILWLARQRSGDLAIPDASFFTDEALAWAVRRDATELRERLNQHLAEMNRDQTLEAIHGKWVGLSP